MPAGSRAASDCSRPLGDLRVREGDIILVLSQDGEWWEGILNGERGYFPGNYVHLL